MGNAREALYEAMRVLICDEMGRCTRAELVPDLDLFATGVIDSLALPHVVLELERVLSCSVELDERTLSDLATLAGMFARYGRE